MSVRVIGLRGRTQRPFQHQPEYASHRSVFATATHAGGGPPRPAVGAGPGGAAQTLPAKARSAAAANNPLLNAAIKQDLTVRRFTKARNSSIRYARILKND